MPESPTMAGAVAHVGVLLGWVVFLGIFLLRRPDPVAETRKSDRASLLGVAFQALGFATIAIARRPRFTPIAPVPPAADAALALLIVALVAGSLWMVWGARRALGKQWSIRARITSGHALVTEGPYRFVRHPIYSGMLGMLVATGLANSHWIALVPAVTLGGIGTWIRVRAEERLLRETFGPAYDAYAREVPALIPRLGRHIVRR